MLTIMPMKTAMMLKVPPTRAIMSRKAVMAPRRVLAAMTRGRSLSSRWMRFTASVSAVSSALLMRSSPRRRFRVGRVM